MLTAMQTGPMLGGVLVESMGFPMLMLTMGILNLIYTPLILILRPTTGGKPTERTALSLFRTKQSGYSRFNNEEAETSESEHR